METEKMIRLFKMMRGAIGGSNVAVVINATVHNATFTTVSLDGERMIQFSYHDQGIDSETFSPVAFDLDVVRSILEGLGNIAMTLKRDRVVFSSEVGIVEVEGRECTFPELAAIKRLYDRIPTYLVNGGTIYLVNGGTIVELAKSVK